MASGLLLLRVATLLVLAFLYLPLAILAIYALQPEPNQAWPPTRFTLRWFGEALANPTLLAAVGIS